MQSSNIDESSVAPNIDSDGSDDSAGIIGELMDDKASDSDNFDSSESQTQKSSQFIIKRNGIQSGDPESVFQLVSGEDNQSEDESRSEAFEDVFSELSDEEPTNEEDGKEKFEIRDYQQKIYKDMVMKDKNSIIFLETGTGKTIISILIIAHYLKEHPKKKIVFLANTQNLVEQQKNQIHKIYPKLVKTQEWQRWKLDKQIFSIHGEKKHKERKTFVLGKEQYKKIKILIISPQTFLNMLRRNSVSLQDVEY